MVLPAALTKDVLKELHDEPLSGHFGVNKTTARVVERYYWAGYTKDIHEFVQSCQVCQKRKPAKLSPKAPLHSIPIESPLKMLAIDFLELPRTPLGNRYVLVVADYFTRWVEAFALPDQRRETVARALVDGVIARHVVPCILHSDQGRNFESHVVRDLCKILGIEKRRVHPHITPNATALWSEK